MSLLNLTNDGFPHILLVLYKEIAKHSDGIPKKVLLDIVAPKDVVQDGKAANTLTRWIGLGLFEESPKKSIKLALAPKAIPETDGEWRNFVPQVVMHQVLIAANNADLWATEDNKAADLTRSLAWMLAQNAYTFSYSNMEDLERRQLGDGGHWVMQNGTRRTGLRRWAPFLGFAHDTGELVIDPTKAIHRVLPHILTPGRSTDAAAFIKDLSSHLPVLDGGTYRMEVERVLAAGSLGERAAHELSTSLSRALFCLHKFGVIAFERADDKNSGVLLTGRDGPIRPLWRTVTLIEGMVK